MLWLWLGNNRSLICLVAFLCCISFSLLHSFSNIVYVFPTWKIDLLSRCLHNKCKQNIVTTSIKERDCLHYQTHMISFWNSLAEKEKDRLAHPSETRTLHKRRFRDQIFCAQKVPETLDSALSTGSLHSYHSSVLQPINASAKYTLPFSHQCWIILWFWDFLGVYDVWFWLLNQFCVP